MKKILVTTDGSQNANKALVEAIHIAEALNLNIDILNVTKDVAISPYMQLDSYSIQTTEDIKKQGQRILEDASKFFKDFKGEVNTILRIGNPADVIIKEAEKDEYDLIVMGSRGLGTFTKAMLGSVSNKVLNHVKTKNVLIIK